MRLLVLGSDVAHVATHLYRAVRKQPRTSCDRGGCCARARVSVPPGSRRLGQCGDPDSGRCAPNTLAAMESAVLICRPANPPKEPIQPMTLGMRRLGVRSLAVSCHQCHHETIINADRWPGQMRVPLFGPRVVCTKCGAVGADARPNWREQPQRESLTGVQWRWRIP
jgi:hypothetical protein